ncbi:MAG: DUF4190 domain-containing protein [Armatimonadota bacterium]
MDENQDRSQNQESPESGPEIPQMTPVEAEPSPKTNSLAIISLILGILTYCTAGITGIVGIVLGIISLVQINRSPGSLKGSGIAAAGIITSILLMSIMAVNCIPMFARSQEETNLTYCLTNMKKINMAMLAYSADYNDHFLLSNRWNDVITDYNITQSNLHCPSEKTPGPSYAMNRLLSGASVENIVSPPPDEIVQYDVPSVYDSMPGVNHAGGPELLPSPPRHSESRSVFGFADGHCLPLSQEDRYRLRLRWDPAKPAEPALTNNK